MAKRRKRKKSSSKCPEPFNTLIDIAGGLAMGAVASHMEKKYRYTAKGKINPYAVSAFGISSGRMKTTEDILRTGAILGALGSFDVEADGVPTRHSYVADDPIFYDIPEAKRNDNRYAWRLNCEDGSEHGIDPENYETREEYNDALRQEKYGWRLWCEDGSEYGVDPEDYEDEYEYEEALEEAKQASNDTEDEDAFIDEPDEDVCNSVPPTIKTEDEGQHLEPEQIVAAPEMDDPYADDDFHVFVYCQVELAETKEQRYYRTEDRSLKKGEKILVPDLLSGNPVLGVILSVEHHMRFSVPQPVKETLEIIDRAE